MRRAISAQQVGEAAVSHTWVVKWRVKGRVHLHLGVGALVDGVCDVGGVQFRDEGGTRGLLDAVHRPETAGVGFGGIGWVGDGGCVQERAARGRGVVGGERDVVRGVPVLGGDLEGQRGAG